jgi:2-methylcitrate dehydratase PrpD
MMTASHDTSREMRGSAPTREIASFAAQLKGDALPADVIVTLGDLVLDYLRVASLGANQPWSRWAHAYMDQLGGNGRARVLFETDTRDPVRAVFLNATYAGSIDADDTHVGSMLHPGSIVISAALAASSIVTVSGSEFLAAVAAGYEAMIRIALSIQPSHFQRGFQSTATCGGFGAAVASARLLFGHQADAQTRIAEAIGIVSSFSGGLTQFYQSGSTVKRIHAARAAENGMAASMLVRNGFSGPTDILEGSNGFARAYADKSDFSFVSTGLGTEYLIREVTVKGHACSARVQSAIEGVVNLCTLHSIAPEDIEDIYVGIPAVIKGRLTIPRPVDIQAAQMSLPHSVALAAMMARTTGEALALTVEDFERSLFDENVKSLERRVRCEVDDEVESRTTDAGVPARVTLKLKSGAGYSVFIDTPKGSSLRPFGHEDHVARFEHELSKRWSPQRCHEVSALTEGLAQLGNVQTLIDLLT